MSKPRQRNRLASSQHSSNGHTEASSSAHGSKKAAEKAPVSSFSDSWVNLICAVGLVLIAAALVPFLVKERHHEVEEDIETCHPERYLSQHRVKGFHPVCITRTSEDRVEAVAYVDGRNETLALQTPYDYTALRNELEKALALEHITAETEPPNKYPWAAFTPDGSAKIASLDDAVPDEVGHSRLILVFKGGTWIWPGIEIGHVQRISGLQGIGSISMKTLSMLPLVFEMQHFLDTEECEHIQMRSAPHLKVSVKI